MSIQYLVPVLFLTSAKKLHAVYYVVFYTGHQVSTAESCGQYGCQEAPPALSAIVTHHVVQKPNKIKQEMSCLEVLLEDSVQQ